MWDPMRPELFARIIRHLKSNYECIRIEDYFRDPANYKKNNYCAVVFDDGYRDFIEYALPILHQHRVPASMYVITDCVNNQMPPWTYILDAHFYGTHHRELDVSSLNLPEQLQKAAFANKEERIAYGRSLKPYLKTITDAQRRAVYSHVVGTFDDVAISERLMMSWEEIRGISAGGIEIGSHTVSHPLLAELGAEDEIKAELAPSYHEIARQIGQPPYTISYPIGSYDARVMRVSREVGYKLGLAVDQRIFNTGRDDPYSVPRIELYNESYWKTRTRISGVLPYIKSLIK